ncbi:MAG TPA: acyl carrier protein [bacterium]|jgi:acyl carrier protein|nr:acyl carrier protein [bacterium]
MDREALKTELKKLIVTECQKDLPPEQLDDAELLMGPKARLELDSLDALQISLAVQQKYGKRIEGNNETRNALTSVDTLADFILG